MKNVYVLITKQRTAGTDFPPTIGVGVFADESEARKQEGEFHATAANGCLTDSKVVEAEVVGCADELAEYKAKVKKYVTAHERLLDFCNDHMLRLADEQKKEYAELVAACEECPCID